MLCVQVEGQWAAIEELRVESRARAIKLDDVNDNVCRLLRSWQLATTKEEGEGGKDTPLPPVATRRQPKTTTSTTTAQAETEVARDPVMNLAVFFLLFLLSTL